MEKEQDEARELEKRSKSYRTLFILRAMTKQKLGQHKKTRRVKYFGGQGPRKLQEYSQ